MPDVDGFTSSAVLYLYLTELKEKENYQFELSYIMPRGKEHGLDNKMDLFLDEKKYDLIILPDAGSNDYECHKQLKEIGYDILVLDHHITDRYSENAIVINNQLSQDYPNKDLSGVGVVWKFIDFFNLINELEIDTMKYLDLVALGMISDMMEMFTLENRFICDYGLSHIHNEFFQALIEKQSFSLGEGPLTQIGVAFYITPLINALIRMGNEIEKERLFLAFITPDERVPSTKRGEQGMIESICTQTIRNCTNAKRHQQNEQDKAEEILNMQIMENDLDENKILLLDADDLDTPSTLTGLCAMRIVSTHKKPVMLGRINSEGVMKGSIRGMGSSKLKDFRQFLLDSGLMEYVQG